MLTTALIMAGGQGIRFWPLSRKEKPKQFLRLTGGRYSLLQQTIRRVRKILPPHRIFIVTSEDYLELIREQAGEIPEENIIGEPRKKNTAPAIGLSALHVEMKYPASVMIVLPSDHVIKNEAAFVRNVKRAVRAAGGGGNLITLGITPTHPETGYGYICYDKRPREGRERGIYRVTGFTEKPDIKRAEDFLAAGNYLWNSGIFIWQTRSILQAVKTHLPGLHLSLERINRALGTGREKRIIAREYRRLRPVSIDTGVLEKTESISVIPADFGWDDLGNWLALQRVHRADRRGNIILGKHLGIDTSGSIVYSPDEMVMSVGLKDMLVVNTGESFLICNKNRLDDIKSLLSVLK